MVLKTKRNVAEVHADNDDEDENKCCLCMDTIKVWAVGACNHPVCYVCSSRMRVLGTDKETRNQCAICKQEMKAVVFHDSSFNFNNIKLDKLRSEKEYGIFFFNDDSEELFRDLLREKCTICGTKCDSLRELKQHMSKTHQLFQCDLCTDNYLLFPAERKWYNRADLARHKRKGDPDDKSHKGHPLCTFCDVRFLDEHELYRHLRRDHHLCHICEADNGSREFIKCIDELVRHFRRKHFLCEHRDCLDNPLTSAFRTEFDLKVHVADRHGGISRKDLRMEVGVDRKSAANRQAEIEEELEQVQNQPMPNVADQESFPTLGGKTGGKTPMGGSKKPVAQQSYRSLSSQNINSREDFPTLGGGAPLAPAPNWNSKTKTANVAGVSEFASKKKKKNKVSLAPKSSYVPENPASASIGASTTSNWSAEPDRFVEKSQLELRAEREAARRAAAPKQAKAMAKGDFPSLGGSAPKPQQFWGVPGASIAKSGNTGKKKKVIQSKAKVARVDFSNKKPKVTSPPPPPKSEKPLTIDHITASLSENSINGPQSNGPNESGWSAPPEVFKEKSLLEIDNERRQKQNQHKNKGPAPKQHDFPTLGVPSKSAASSSPSGAFWGVPGASIPKSSSAKKVIKNTARVVTKPKKPEPKVHVEPITFDKPTKKERVYVEPTYTDSQNASAAAARMSGGSSGWSAPPTVFKEKSLLEIEEERRRNQNKHKNKGQAPKIDQSAFPTLGGTMSKQTKVDMAFEYRATTSYNPKFTQNTPIPSSSTTSSISAAERMRMKAAEEKEDKKMKEQAAKAAKKNKSTTKAKTPPPPPPVVESSDEFISADEGDSHHSTDEEDDEAHEDDSMATINARLMASIGQLSSDDQATFRLASGRFRAGDVTAMEYVEIGMVIMGRGAFLSILPDLLRTLPQGATRAALNEAQLTVHAVV